jgi:hypothetical protein
VNAILGREVVSLFGVIRIFLSELAIFFSLRNKDYSIV